MVCEYVCVCVCVCVCFLRNGQWLMRKENTKSEKCVAT